MDAALARQAETPPPAQPRGPFPAERQKAMGKGLMARLGFDFEAGRLDESTHPFCGGTPTDIRITTFYSEAEVGKALMGVVHETGQARKREERMDAEYSEVDVLVFGHSHIPWDTTTPGGIRLLNPGSPTDRRRQPHHTMMTVVVDDGVLRDVELRTL